MVFPEVPVLQPLPDVKGEEVCIGYTRHEGATGLGEASDPGRYRQATARKQSYCVLGFLNLLSR